MPIKSAVFGAPEEPKSEPAAAPPEAPTTAPEPAKRTRRTKAELIEAAVVPADDAVTEVKFIDTGSKGERPWLVAVELFRDKKAEFVDKTLKYAVDKMDQIRAASKAPEPSPAPPAEAPAQDTVDALTLRWRNLQKLLDETSSPEKTVALAEEAELVRGQIVALGGPDVARAVDASGVHDGKTGDPNIPPDAAIGDEVRIGAETYRLGHGRVLTRGPMSTPDGTVIKPKQRWQRELGTGGKGPWEPTLLDSSAGIVADVFGAAAQPAATNGSEVAAPASTEVFKAEPAGNSVELVSPGVYRVTMGYLETIGLPDYSSLKIGPATVTHEVADDGRRTKVNMGGRLVELPTAVIEAQVECAQISEFVMRSERQSMVNFLESVKPGSTKTST